MFVHVWRRLALGVHACTLVHYGLHELWSATIVWKTAAWVTGLWSTVSGGYGQPGYLGQQTIMIIIIKIMKLTILIITH